MVGFVDAFGLVSGGVGLVQFMMDLIPDPPTADGAEVVIKIGKPGGEWSDESTDGDIANIYAWDMDNKYQGKATGGYIGKGGIGEYIIDADVAGAQTSYLGVTADTDAACIAWITIAQRDKTKKASGRWTGDVGYHCGRSWHFNQETAGETPNGDDYKPRCTWLDADHSDDLEDAALKFDIRAYGGDSADTVDEGKECDYTSFGPDNGPISAAPGKRSLKPRSQAIKDVLIVSDISSQSAEELCLSATSWGWDFIGPDGMFCDMETHRLTPLCSHEEVDGCINLDEENGAKRLTRRSLTKRGDGFLTASDKIAKEYGEIAHW